MVSTNLEISVTCFLYSTRTLIQIHATSELSANASNAFGVKLQKSPDEVEQKLYSQIGKLTMEVDF